MVDAACWRSSVRMRVDQFMHAVGVFMIVYIDDLTGYQRVRLEREGVGVHSSRASHGTLRTKRAYQRSIKGYNK